MPDDVEAEIRKLRKKLRQIERLERSGKELNEEEEIKVCQKFEVRSRLLDLVSELPLPSNSFNSTFTGASETSFKSTGTEQTSFSSVNEENTREEESPDLSEVAPYDPWAEHEASPPNDFEETDDLESDMKRRSHNEGERESHQEATSSEEKKPKVETPEVNPSSGGVQANQKPPEAKAGKSDPVPVASSTKKQKAPTKKAVGKKECKAEVRPQGWSGRRLEVSFLEGHNDVVCCAVTDGQYLVTGSRDTTVKIWRLQTQEEVSSLGSHTMTVTSVTMVTWKMAPGLWKHFGLDEDDSLVLSGSLDCSIKLWSRKSGKLIESIYTFNPVTCMDFFEAEELFGVGSGGGKIELWDVAQGQCVSSLTAHTEAVTKLQVAGDHIYSCSEDGQLQVFHVRNKQLHVIFVSENIKTRSGALLPWRPIHSMCVANERMYFGDDGPNLKVLDWKSGFVHKLGQHRIEFGSTDALCSTGDVLLCSGYDLDNGLGYINVRSLPEETYLGTISDGDTSRITCLASVQASKGKLVMISGGLELKLWTFTSDTSGENVVCMQHNAVYERTPEHSEPESETEASEEDEEDAGVRRRTRKIPSEEEESGSSWWWCNLL